MTHRWCSGESDAPAVMNMESMPFEEFRTHVRALSTFYDDDERQAQYDLVLTTLHDEAIFLPLTYRKNIAVVNSRVSGFAFGSTEFDIPISSFFPTPPPEPEPVDSAIIIVAAVAAVVVGILVLCLCCLLMQERAGKPVFKPVTPPSAA